MSTLSNTSIPNPGWSISALPYFALLAGMATLSFGTSLAKELFPIVGASGTVAYRVGFSAIILLVIWRPWRHRFTRREIMALVKFGTALGMMNLCFYLSLETLPLGIALAIEFLGPLGVALMGARRLIDFSWFALTALGLALLLPFEGSASRLDPGGVAFAAAAAFFWGCYIILGRKTVHLHAGHSIAIGMSIAAIVIVPFGVLNAASTMFEPSLLLFGFAIAVISSAIPYSLEMIALQRLPGRVFGTMLSIEPAFGAMAGFLLLSETLSVRQFAAILCVILASAGTVLTEHRKRAMPL